jgi:hypothetical protein
MKALQVRPTYFHSLSNAAKTCNAETETSSLVHVDPVADNADLYEMPLPEYTRLATNGERSVNAEATRDENSGFEDRSPAYEAPENTTPLQQQLSTSPSHLEWDPELKGETNTSPTRSVLYIRRVII